MILTKDFSNKENGKYLTGKVSPSNLRWYGVEDELISAYNQADDKLQAFCGCTTDWNKETNAERDRLFEAKKEAQKAIEQRLSELSK